MPEGQPFSLASKMAPGNRAFMASWATVPATATSIAGITSLPLHKQAPLRLAHSSLSSSRF